MTRDTKSSTDSLSEMVEKFSSRLSELQVDIYGRHHVAKILSELRGNEQGSTEYPFGYNKSKVFDPQLFKGLGYIHVLERKVDICDFPEFWRKIQKFTAENKTKIFLLVFSAGEHVFRSTIILNDKSLFFKLKLTI